MIKTLLIDLDDTLLDNDMQRFLPAYLNRLGTHLSHIAAPDQIAHQVMVGSLAMVQNQDPTRTLREIFSQSFFPEFEVTEVDLQPQIDFFYREVFPTLRTHTASRDGAAELLRSAFKAGLEVVVATSPLFPLTAIEQRLAWAGVSVQDFPYDLVTSYEDFHFAKPNLAYYGEILGRLGRPAQEAVMIGNDPYDDLIPAQTMGMSVFHLHASSSDFPHGDLHMARQWLIKDPHQTRSDPAVEPQVLLARMRGQLSALLTISDGIEQALWAQRPRAWDWAPVEIVCHLRDAEKEAHLPRLQTILKEDSPHLAGIDTDAWAEERAYIHQSGPGAVMELIQTRLEILAQLESSPISAWSRPARHSLLGPTTLAELLRIAVDHELLHLDQLRTTLACLQT